MIFQNVVIYKMTKLFEVYAFRRVGEIEPQLPFQILQWTAPRVRGPFCRRCLELSTRAAGIRT